MDADMTSHDFNAAPPLSTPRSGEHYMANGPVAKDPIAEEVTKDHSAAREKLHVRTDFQKAQVFFCLPFIVPTIRLTTKKTAAVGTSTTATATTLTTTRMVWNSAALLMLG